MSGIYVSVKPTIGSLSILEQVAKYSALPMVKADELHCTVVTSSQGSEKEYQDVANPLMKFRSTIKDIAVFNAPALGGKVMVAELESEDLTQRHQFWERIGVKDNFPSFKPHVTLTPNIGQFSDGLINAAVGNLRGLLIGTQLVFHDETLTDNRYA